MTLRAVTVMAMMMVLVRMMRTSSSVRLVGFGVGRRFVLRRTPPRARWSSARGRGSGCGHSWSGRHHMRSLRHRKRRRAQKRRAVRQRVLSRSGRRCSRHQHRSGQRSRSLEPRKPPVQRIGHQTTQFDLERRAASHKPTVNQCRTLAHGRQQRTVHHRFAGARRHRTRQKLHAPQRFHRITK
jgi:hypothetical protein